MDVYRLLCGYNSYVMIGLCHNKCITEVVTSVTQISKSRMIIYIFEIDNLV